MSEAAKPKRRRLSRKELKRLDVQAHNQAFDELRVRYRRGYPTNDALFASKKEIFRDLERKASLIP